MTATRCNIIREVVLANGLPGAVMSRNTPVGNAYSALRGDRDNMGHALVILGRDVQLLYTPAINKDLSPTETWT